MKFTGHDSYAFNLLESQLNRESNKKRNNKKNTITEKKITELIDKSNHRIFSPWELRVYDKLKKSKIEFNIKSRRFPLQLDKDLKNIYTPDFILKNRTFKNKKIVIEAHEDLTDGDIIRYAMFMKKFGISHHLIMIVQDGQLRDWNEINNKKHPLFHDIWVVDDLDLFIKSLDKYVNNKICNVELPDYAACPKCNVNAKGTEMVEKLFGYRTVKNRLTITQSYCRNCRSNKTKFKTMSGKKISTQLSSPITRYCSECKTKFTTQLASQAHCNICLKKFD